MLPSLSLSQEDGQRRFLPLPPDSTQMQFLLTVTPKPVTWPCTSRRSDSQAFLPCPQQAFLSACVRLDSELRTLLTIPQPFCDCVNCDV